MGRYFGTDGIRGSFGTDPMTELFAFRLALALGNFINQQTEDSLNSKIIIGRDTRFSGQLLESAMQKAFDSVGISVNFLGIVPTPAVALGVLHFNASLGIALTASHNPASDNGIKLFNHKGEKFSIAEESKIEETIDSLDIKDSEILAVLEEKVQNPISYLDSSYYNEKIQLAMKTHSLKGFKIVLDCANGASFQISPQVLKALGADLVLIGVSPNGENINNQVGSEYPENLAKLVIEHKADLGLAHDGDADRLVVCDEKGRLLDGDLLIGLYALHALKMNKLNNKTIVLTVQSNLGLDKSLQEAGLKVVRVPVGDRNVAEKMRELGAQIGGESSGHILFLDSCPAGDGLLAALELLKLLIEEECHLSEMHSLIKLYPQKTKNLKVREKVTFDQLPRFKDVIKHGESLLGVEGRVLVRYSGTESKLRILVESKSENLASEVMQIIVTEACNSLSII